MKHLNWHSAHSGPPPRKNGWAAVLGVLLALGILLWILKPFGGGKKREPDARGITVTDALLAEGAFDREQASAWLVDAVIQIESQGDPLRVGTVGERGLMQIRESTWREVTRRHLGEEIPFDRAFEPELNRQVGQYYLGDLQRFLYAHREEWRSDLRSLLLACYNAGPERVRQSGFDLKKLPRSVRSYAERGSALHDWYLSGEAETLHRLLEQSAPQPE